MKTNTDNKVDVSATAGKGKNATSKGNFGNKVTSMGRFEKLINSTKASEFATEIGFAGKEREDYFYLLYLQNLPLSDYNAWQGFHRRLAWEISEISCDKKGNQSTVWDVVTALNTLIMKGNWDEEGNKVTGDLNSLVLHNLYTNIKQNLDYVISSFKWDDDFTDEVLDKVYGLNFDNPYAA